MASANIVTNDAIIVYGYVRTNFADMCWINEIIQIILQFYMSKCGSLYVFGNGRSGALGIAEYEHKECKKPTLCPLFDKMNVLDVSTNGHTLILDVDGQVWSCGYGECGQLGNGKEKDVSTPQKLKLIQPVIQVAAGGFHSLILLNNGHAQSFGKGNCGQLGHGDNENVYTPKTIKALKQYKIIKICAGYSQSACLTEDENLFCFGENQYGQCGVGDEDEVATSIMIPTKIAFDKRVILMECGDDFTLLVGSNKRIYSFGKSKWGQLGHGCEHDHNEFIPIVIEALKQKNIQKLAAGGRHSVCIDEGGIVWIFGDNVMGQCGLGEDIHHQLTPKVIEYFVSNKIKAIDCAAGDEQSSVISEDGSLYVFGCNDSYELALEETKVYFTPTELPLPQNKSALKVSMGYEYAAVITE